MPDVTLSLALYDFLPVLLTGIALWFLAGFVRQADSAGYPMALLGGALILAGGFSKASWKLILAATGVDLGWLASALFPLMAPGFALLAVAIWGAARRARARRPLIDWRSAWLLIGLAFTIAALRMWVLDIPRGWFMPLLLLASLGNLIVSLQLIAMAFFWRRPAIAILVMVNLVMILALQPIAMAVSRTTAMHWLEQSVTTLGAACLAVAAYRLWRLLPNPEARPRPLSQGPD